MSDNVITAKVPFEKPQPPVAADPSAPVTAEVPEGTLDTGAAPEVAAPPEAAAPAAESEVASAEDFGELMAPFQEELVTSGELSNESLDKLAEALKAPRELIEVTYEGMKSRQAARDTEILTVAGGRDSYNEMVAWAASAFSAEEAQAFNTALVSGTKGEALEAISQLRGKFTAVNGTPAAVVTESNKQRPTAAPVAPRPPADPALKPFESFSELMEAQRDKRYGTDSAYTSLVYKRASISTKI